MAQELKPAVALKLKEPASREEIVKAPSWAGLPRSRPGTVNYIEAIVGGSVVMRHSLESRPAWTLGRHEEFAQIISTHESVSRQHALLIFNAAEARWYISDLNSAHGTRIGSKRLDPYIPFLLVEGNSFTLGTEKERLYSLKLDNEGLEVEERPTKRAKVEVDRVHCSHILAKHSKSRNPTSWRQEGQISRTKDEAIAQIKTIRSNLLGLLEREGREAVSREFAAVARVRSDCSSAKRGGDLGIFGRGQMQPSFEKAAFALSPGELSDIVQSDSGIHVIWRHLGET